MQAHRPMLLMILACAFAWWSDAEAAAPAGAVRSDLQMSAGLRRLFQQEMLELLTGTRTIAASLPAGDWKGISAASAMMQHSYVLEKSLTGEQRGELSRLPEEFRALDEAFHLRANKLERAAGAKDAEEVAFQFGRLLETCAVCHARFARETFPAFGADSRDGAGKDY